VAAAAVALNVGDYAACVKFSTQKLTEIACLAQGQADLKPQLSTIEQCSLMLCRSLLNMRDGTTLEAMSAWLKSAIPKVFWLGPLS
jgi:hypothetical protein